MADVVTVEQVGDVTRLDQRAFDGDGEVDLPDAGRPVNQRVAPRWPVSPHR